MNKESRCTKSLEEKEHCSHKFCFKKAQSVEDLAENLPSLEAVWEEYEAIKQKIFEDPETAEIAEELMRIYSIFVRHGETVLNKKKCSSGIVETPLTKEGRTQIFKIGKNHKGKIFQRIYNSPLKRSGKSVNFFCKGLGIKDIPRACTAELSERCKGEAERQKKDEFPRDIVYSFENAPPGGENFSSVLVKCLSFLNRLIQFNYDYYKSHKKLPKTLVVTHQGPLRIFRAILEEIAKPKNILDKEFKQEHEAINSYEKGIDYNWPQKLIEALGGGNEIDENIKNMGKMVKEYEKSVRHRSKKAIAKK